MSTLPIKVIFLLQAIIACCSSKAQPPTFSFIELQVGEVIHDSLIMKGPDYGYDSISSHHECLVKFSDYNEIIELTSEISCDQVNSYIREISGSFGHPKETKKKGMGEVKKKYLRWNSPDGKYMVFIVQEESDLETYCKFSIVNVLGDIAE